MDPGQHNARLAHHHDPEGPLSPAALLILTSHPDTAGARQLAETLVTEGLAACVHVFPAGTSIYVWQGGLERGREHQLLIKAPAQRADDIVARIRTLHPYELPEILTVPVTGGLAEYLAWLAQPESPA